MAGSKAGEHSMDRWMMLRRFFALTLAGLTACSEPTKPDASGTTFTLLPPLKKSILVECPTEESQSASAIIASAVGGVVSVSGHSVTLAPNALPTGEWVVTLTAPASKYVELELSVTGAPYVSFSPPAIVTIDYSRCARSNIDRAPLRAWYIDSVTKELLENMGGVDDKILRKLTFTTDHFSGYAVAQ
jgi:hypothetical protein